MTNVLGYELTQAVTLLQQEGYRVQTVEVSSKKGLAGNEKRVIRQKQNCDNGEKCMTLSYSVFRTECMQQK